MIIGQIVGSKKLELDLPALVDTRLLIQANSGGGKSWLLRLIAERAGIQTIVLDNEGEFASLREAVDVLLVGAGGELTADRSRPLENPGSGSGRGELKASDGLFDAREIHGVL
jgi:DNA helicase HerA-like ATPase